MVNVLMYMHYMHCGYILPGPSTTQRLLTAATRVLGSLSMDGRGRSSVHRACLMAPLGPTTGAHTRRLHSHSVTLYPRRVWTPKFYMATSLSNKIWLIKRGLLGRMYINTRRGPNVSYVLTGTGHQVVAIESRN